MTNKFTGFDPEWSGKITKGLGDYAEMQGDVLETLIATKGQAYAMQVSAVAATSNMFRTTNTMICGEIPQEIVGLCMKMQAQRINDLIEPFFMAQIPGGDEASKKQRWAACDEFIKNVEILIHQRQRVEEKLGRIIVGEIGDTLRGEEGTPD